MIPTAFIVLCLLSLFAEASPVSRGESPVDSAVVVFAILQDSPIHHGPFAANGSSIWIGKDTASYCPPVVEERGECPKGKDTSFWVNDRCGMNVIVPGGQQAYVAPDGRISYTAPHSAYIPPGSITTGFHLIPTQFDGFWEFVIDSHEFFACPETPGQGPWQVIVADENSSVPGRDLTDCLKFEAFAKVVKDPVWEYLSTLGPESIVVQEYL
ncbi:hypothetical protein MHUMG1_04553 [Metarhizium humberi]|uniref:IgE-binding protein n=1 Tax=Metarhizium humberi TaxID=2596975 RepID=A0A9P8M9D2_9HYPO|nr:hypothetical protein MHUMG1_04553 [Metarhizium humberi]